MTRAWLVAAIVFFFGTTALGQAVFGGSGGFDPMGAPVTTAEADRLAKDAGLDEAAKASMRALVQACDESLQAQARRMQRRYERLYLTAPSREEADPVAYRQMYEKESKDQIAEHDRLSATLLNDLHAMVPTERGEAWASFERRRHRRMYLGGSSRTGVAVDLVGVAERHALADVPVVRDILDPYERSLDRLLLARVPVVKEAEEKMYEAQQRADGATAERVFNALRDADCAILHLQRDTTRKLLETVPKEKLGDMRDLLLTSRSPYIQTKPPVRLRAERVAKSKRVTGANLEALQQAIRTFDDRSRTLDEKGLTETEDRECNQTYAQAMQGDGGDAWRQWYEDSRKLQAELLTVLERVATDDDLDWADRQAPEPEPETPEG